MTAFARMESRIPRCYPPGCRQPADIYQNHYPTIRAVPASRQPLTSTAMPALDVQLNRLSLPNPILVASGTFGYAREMTAFVQFEKLGGIIPKTVTPAPRAGNPPPRTIETSSGLLNSIGLDNDGFDQFMEEKLPYLTGLGAPVIVNIAARTNEEFRRMADRLNAAEGIAAVELNISCPNVSGGVDFGTDPDLAGSVVETVCSAGPLPVIAKLTPNVTSVVPIAKAVADAGADAGVTDQHVSGHGNQLASTQTRSGKCPWRPQRTRH